MTKFFIFLLTGLLVSCGGSSGPGAGEPVTAYYRVTFKTIWTVENFPTAYPTSSHFSGLVGAIHNKNIVFWSKDKPASEGIKNMAESGAKTQLLSDVNAGKVTGTVLEDLSGGGISVGGTEVTLNFSINSNYPLVTLVSMVAPSPDWFVGVNGLELYSNGQWKDNVDVDLEIYDAGTDDGKTYSSADVKSNPLVNINKLTSNPADTDFNQGVHRGSGKYIATFSFQRL